MDATLFCVRVLRKRARILAAAVRSFEQSMAREFEWEAEVVRHMNLVELSAYESLLDKEDASGIAELVRAAARRRIAER